jgi:hypothetical protein
MRLSEENRSMREEIERQRGKQDGVCADLARLKEATKVRQLTEMNDPRGDTA